MIQDGRMGTIIYQIRRRARGTGSVNARVRDLRNRAGGQGIRGRFHFQVAILAKTKEINAGNDSHTTMITSLILQGTTLWIPLGTSGMEVMIIIITISGPLIGVFPW